MDTFLSSVSIDMRRGSKTQYEIGTVFYTVTRSMNLNLLQRGQNGFRCELSQVRYSCHRMQFPDNLQMFKCDCCGNCCRNLSLSSIYSDLNRGDGVCKFLDETTSLCSIYADRPTICNVDLMYNLCFSSRMTLEEFYMLNNIICQKLKGKMM